MKSDSYFQPVLQGWTRKFPLVAIFFHFFFITFFFLFFAISSWANLPEFSAIKLGSASTAVLIVGGIQGDEPGGFSAATLLATNYEILSGAVIVVPNLNFPSIIKRSRGLYGDMNRKFANLARSDPEYETVKKIQQLINSPQVSLVLNLHDGSGYYRPKYVDKLRNPARWGQSIIIDQEYLHPEIIYGDLNEKAERVAKKANRNLIKKEHSIHIHNTKTALGDKEMEKSLSYYAVKHSKAAFGLEASKEFPVPLRTYYHLLMIEEFLEIAGIKFQRNFELSPAGIERALGKNLAVAFASNRIYLPLEDVRREVNFFPLPKNSLTGILFAKPTMAALPCEESPDTICVHYGNNIITSINPEWHETDETIDGLSVIIDGKRRKASFGQIIDVKKEIIIDPQKGYRINAIGLDSGLEDESGRLIRHSDFEISFSVDRGGTMFRVETYKKNKFAGMFIIRYIKQAKATKVHLPGHKGRESGFGF